MPVFWDPSMVPPRKKKPPRKRWLKKRTRVALFLGFVPSAVPPVRSRRRRAVPRRLRRRWVGLVPFLPTLHYPGWVEAARGVSFTEPGRATKWAVPTMTVLVKRAAESRTYTMDFSQQPEIAGGQVLSSVVSVAASPAGLTVGTGTISGSTVQVTLSGGTDGVLYQVSFTVTTNANPAATLVGIGYLQVDDQ
jgi:hypothetical protein